MFAQPNMAAAGRTGRGDPSPASPRAVRPDPGPTLPRAQAPSSRRPQARSHRPRIGRGGLGPGRACLAHGRGESLPRPRRPGPAPPSLCRVLEEEGDVFLF